MKLGIVARMDLGSGLQSQSLNLCKMLKPDKVLLIDSTPFNKAIQRPDLYDQFETDKVMGFPSTYQYKEWFKGLTHILAAETMYNDNAIRIANDLGIKTFIQPNFEFMDSLIRPMAEPTKYFMPSYWMLDKVREKFPQTVYLPPPLYPNDFKNARESHSETTRRRFVHIVGKHASKDRNGTRSVLDALKFTGRDFEIVIKTQYPLEFDIEDHRVTVEVKNVEDPQDLYKGFDAMILPRRYGGLCLPLNEALISGLPVIMTDLLPQNKILPSEWLVEAKVYDSLQARMSLNVYNADAMKLAERIEWLCSLNLKYPQALAFEMGMEYSADNLRDKYLEEMEA